MQISVDSQEAAVPEGDMPQGRSPRKKRRGATSMEYCVMASFILLVVIAAVQAFGFTVGGIFTSNAAATSKFSAGPKPGP
jgi:Flp pilus assembly pilin Flp